MSAARWRRRGVAVGLLALRRRDGAGRGFLNLSMLNASRIGLDFGDGPVGALRAHTPSEWSGLAVFPLRLLTRMARMARMDGWPDDGETDRSGPAGRGRAATKVEQLSRNARSAPRPALLSSHKASGPKPEQQQEQETALVFLFHSALGSALRGFAHQQASAKLLHSVQPGPSPCNKARDVQWVAARPAPPRPDSAATATALPRMAWRRVAPRGVWGHRFHGKFNVTLPGPGWLG